MARFVQTTLPADLHKILKKLAIDKEITIGELMREIIINYLNEKENKQWQTK